MYLPESTIFHQPTKQFLTPKKFTKKQSTAGIRWWSPTQLLACRHNALVRLSGREALFSLSYGRLRKRVVGVKYIFEEKREEGEWENHILLSARKCHSEYRPIIRETRWLYVAL
jgi:hypothetical protein